VLSQLSGSSAGLEQNSIKVHAALVPAETAFRSFRKTLIKQTSDSEIGRTAIARVEMAPNSSSWKTHSAPRDPHWKVLTYGILCQQHQI
jgi:hypothetical protein